MNLSLYQPTIIIQTYMVQCFPCRLDWHLVVGHLVYSILASLPLGKARAIETAIFMKQLATLVAVVACHVAACLGWRALYLRAANALTTLDKCHVVPTSTALVFFALLFAALVQQMSCGKSLRQ